MKVSKYLAKAAFFLCAAFYAEELEMPSFPTISPPTMPTLSPSLSNKGSLKPPEPPKKPELPPLYKSEEREKLPEMEEYPTPSSLSSLYEDYTDEEIHHLIEDLKESPASLIHEVLRSSLRKQSEGPKARISTSTKAEKSMNKERKILRFTINSYDIRPEIKGVFFSIPEDDGSFLLTGETEERVKGEKRKEIFYFLFNAKGFKQNALEYEVNLSVLQEKEERTSLLYKLSGRKLSAIKVGNMVSMRVKDEEITADLLLDLAVN